MSHITKSHITNPSVAKPEATDPAAAVPDIAALIRKVKTSSAPPSITELSDTVSIGETYQRFKETVTNLLPEQAEHILSTRNTHQQVDRFNKAFEEQYLPLSDYITSTGVFDQQHPIITMFEYFPYPICGYSMDEIHQVWKDGEPGPAAMLLLTNITKAYSHTPYPALDNGIRTAWFEEASQYIDLEVLQKIPPDGIDQTVLEKAVQGTRFEALAEVFPWYFSFTDNYFLSTSYDDDIFTYGDNYFELELVQGASAQWKEASTIMKKVHDLSDWIEQDLSANFNTIVDHILSSQAFKEAAQQT